MRFSKNLKSALEREFNGQKPRMRSQSIYILGSVNLDLVTEVAVLARPGETVAGFSTSEFAGGKGANQAVAAARMGVEVSLIGALGRDDVGQGLKAFLSGGGVNTQYLLEMEGESTGRAFIFVEAGGENAIVVAGGANLALRPEHIPTAESLENTICLAQLETPLETVAAFFRRAAAKNTLKILNTAPAHLGARALFELLDIIILNETELQSFANLTATPKDRTQFVDAARSLMARSDQSVIVTLGAAGALIVTQSDAQMIEGRQVLAIDTTGAGDCFCGVLAAFLAQGAPLDDAVARANAAAALSVCKAGAVVSMPYRAELDDFMTSFSRR